jgi:hypothetical protein
LAEPTVSYLKKIGAFQGTILINRLVTTKLLPAEVLLVAGYNSSFETQKKTAAFQVTFVINQIVTAKFRPPGILRKKAGIQDKINRKLTFDRRPMAR